MDIIVTYITGENSSGNVIWDHNHEKTKQLSIPDDKIEDDVYVEEKLAEEVPDTNIKLVKYEKVT
ncbi:hypothetical protein [Alkalicoccus chagannorensis]|uniref:hypothetical protein n=1 Tax=Alkalicoccus chagannorensis TaxID=427072 RepID=UPI0004039D07|nr:hypothetical protein [Alkalicoccus chagannorensis]